MNRVFPVYRGYIVIFCYKTGKLKVISDEKSRRDWC